MDDLYTLMFRGEVLEGQHPAVVRKRLAKAAGFRDEQLDRLFSGRPVILKRAADTATAARLQALFKKAGARLRVLPAEAGDGAPSAAATPADDGSAGAEAPAGGGSSGLELLPPGSDVLRADERRLPMAAADAPDFEVAAVGADLAPRRAPAPPPVDADRLTFEVAPPGETLGVPAAPPAQLPPDTSHLQLSDDD
jgi:hypothetical protein